MRVLVFNHVEIWSESLIIAPDPEWSVGQTFSSDTKLVKENLFDGGLFKIHFILLITA